MKVKVYNDNVHDFNQTFRDDKIHIPAKGYIEMDEDDAHSFECQYHPPTVDAGGTQMAESYKMLRVDRPGGPSRALDPWTCQACNYKGVSKEDLNSHVKARLHLNDGHKILENETALSAEEVVEGLMARDDVMELLAAKLSAKMAPKKASTKNKEA